MCGRYALSSSVELLIELFGLAEASALVPRYNIAPTQYAPVIRALPGRKGARGEQVRRLDLLHWGLIPAWSREPMTSAARAKLINARVESADRKRSFRDALLERRCLVPIDGFYEWHTDAQGRKRPHFIRSRSGEPLALAGLWERWQGRVGARAPEAPIVPATEFTTQRGAHDSEVVIESFTILTTPSNAVVARLHDRMPAIIAPEDFERWLDPALHDPSAIVATIRQAPDDLLVSHAVSRYVSSAVNEGPGCVEPVGEEEDEDDEENPPARKDERQGRLF